jgi:phage shock protein PspC (stress-responsive transcriptional regulator)
MVSGVSAGLGHYFGIDAVWVRIIFILLVWGTGSSCYIILWIVVPAAVTTSEKLEMTGEPVNISNIKKVREENVSDKFKNVDYDKYGNQ